MARWGRQWRMKFITIVVEAGVGPNTHLDRMKTNSIKILETHQKRTIIMQLHILKYSIRKDLSYSLASALFQEVAQVRLWVGTVGGSVLMLKLPWEIPMRWPKSHPGSLSKHPIIAHREESNTRLWVMIGIHCSPKYPYLNRKIANYTIQT